MFTPFQLDQKKAKLTQELGELEETAKSDADLKRMKELRAGIQEITDALIVARNREREFVQQQESTEFAKVHYQTTVDARTAKQSRTYQILLVEDSDSDVRMAEEAFKQLDLQFNLSVVPDGVEALAFLRQEATYDDAPRPDLILLDLNMRLKDGRETLKEIKADSHLRSIPVVVFTTSDHDRDIFNAYHNFANAYVVKPRGMLDYMAVMRYTTDFWFKAVKHLLR